MNFVFFDIECASVFKNVAKICAFGYVVCDEQFNVLQKEDILVNPKGKFHLTDRKGQKGLVLPYDYDDFKTKPTFPNVYPQIKNLLEDPNNLVLGHSVMNDVHFLELETQRFKLPSFDFSFSDTQILYMTKVGDYSRQFGLEYIIKDLNVEFTPHKAVDDAYATMKICEAMCKEQNCTLFELEKKLGILHGNIQKHRIKRPTSKPIEAHAREIQRLKNRHARARSELSNYVSRRHPRKGGKWENVVVAFSNEVEMDVGLSKKMIAAIYNAGGTYSTHVPQCSVYVCKEQDDSARTANAQKKADIRFMTPDELLKELV